MPLSWKFVLSSHRSKLLPVPITWIVWSSWLIQLHEPRNHVALNRDTQLLESKCSIKKSSPTGQMVWFELHLKMRNASVRRNEILQEKSTLLWYLTFPPFKLSAVLNGNFELKSQSYLEMSWWQSKQNVIPVPREGEETGRAASLPWGKAKQRNWKPALDSGWFSWSLLTWCLLPGWRTDITWVEFLSGCIGACLRLGFTAGAVKCHFCEKCLCLIRKLRTDKKMSGTGHLLGYRAMNDRQVPLRLWWQCAVKKIASWSRQKKPGFL